MANPQSARNPCSLIVPSFRTLPTACRGLPWHSFPMKRSGSSSKKLAKQLMPTSLSKDSHRYDGSPTPTGENLTSSNSTQNKGYDTEIGQRGAMLSGGQKQRLAIARSVISNPRVLLLDEATSALDPSAERIVQKALNNVAVGRTMVVIAHRLSTIRDADNIVVLSTGKVVEQGTHNELIEQGGVYSRLVRAQDLGQDKDESGPADKSAETERLALSKTMSTREVPGDTAGIAAETPMNTTNYSLLKCLWIIAKDQRGLWVVSIFFIASCIAGGRLNTDSHGWK